VVGDTVGDPFKDTSLVALNPVIKFTTLFGVLAVGLAVELHNKALGHDAFGKLVHTPEPVYDWVRLALAALSLIVSMFFAWRSFYGMRIGNASPAAASGKHAPTAKKPEPAKVEHAKADHAKAEPAKAEHAKAEPAKAEPETMEAAKAEPEKAESSEVVS